MNYPESSIFSAKHMFPCVISDVCRRKGYQMLRTSIFLSTLIFVSGCTLSHISEVKNPFPAETITSIECAEYDDIKKATKGIRAKERYGWLPSTIGYKHSAIFGILSSTIEICFERPLKKKGSSTTANDPS